MNNNIESAVEALADELKQFGIEEAVIIVGKSPDGSPYYGVIDATHERGGDHKVDIDPNDRESALHGLGWPRVLSKTSSVRGVKIDVTLPGEPAALAGHSAEFWLG